jgi:hypothetical protein
MVVCNFNLVGISSLPSEANPILIVDPDAVLSPPVAAQPFQTIPWWNSKLKQVPHPVDLIELPTGNLPQIPGTGSSGSGSVGAIKDVLAAPIPERANHGLYYNDLRESHQLLEEASRIA